MVIDAMRTDFIQNQQNASMKYLNKMISDGTACVMNLNVEVPTVTMPRIKVIFFAFFFVCISHFYNSLISCNFTKKIGNDNRYDTQFYRCCFEFGQFGASYGFIIASNLR